MKDAAFQTQLKWRKVELANLKRNRDKVEPEMLASLDKRVAELEVLVNEQPKPVGSHLPPFEETLLANWRK